MAEFLGRCRPVGDCPISSVFARAWRAFCFVIAMRRGTFVYLRDPPIGKSTLACCLTGYGFPVGQSGNWFCVRDCFVRGIFCSPASGEMGPIQERALASPTWERDSVAKCRSDRRRLPLGQPSDSEHISLL